MDPSWQGSEFQHKYSCFTGNAEFSSLALNNNEVFRVTNIGAPVVVKKYLTQSGADALVWEHQLIDWLSKQNLDFTFPVPIKNIDGQTLTQVGDRLVVVYPYLEGRNLDYNSDADVRILASVTADLQNILESCPLTDRPGTGLFQDPFKFARSACEPYPLSPKTLRITNTPEANALLQYWSLEAFKLEKFFAGAFYRLPRQLCHNDVTSGNVLAYNGKAVAVLDFEFAGVNPRVLDLAMGIRMAMQVWQRIDPWKKLQTYGESYRDRINTPLAENEILAIPDLIKYRSAMSIFLRLNRLNVLSNHSPILHSIENFRRNTDWLEKNNARFVDELYASLY